MTDFEKIELAFNILEAAEVMQEFDNDLWIKVDRDMWEEFNAPPTQLIAVDLPPQCITPYMNGDIEC